MRTFFVCTVTADGYSHQEYQSREAADAARGQGCVIAVENGEIVDAPFDAPGVAIRAVKRVLKWRGSE
jgi:hypothetical protein